VTTPRLVLASWPATCQLPGQPPRELAPREAALLAWLAVEGPTPRARLAAVLWPDSDEAAQRNALRQRLFQLKRQFGCDLALGTTTLALAAGVQHDLADADGLLGDIEHHPSEAFAAWLQQQRQRRQQRSSERWVRDADVAENARDYDTALAWARQILAHEPTSELAHRRVMRLHYLRGDRAAALLAFDACERALKDEVGTRPDAQTMALLAMIESATGSAPPAPMRSLPPGLLRPPRLVGRDDTVAQVLTPLARGHHVLLLAEAGLGKTRLLEECADALAVQGTPAVSLGARPGDATRPFALLARVLNALVAEPQRLPDADRAVLAWASPAFGPTPQRALEAGPFEAAVARVLAGPGVLLIDDLHHADNASIELLLRCLAEPASAQGRRWVMAVRPAEVPPALQAWRAGVGVALQPAELQLHTLAEDGIAALITSLGVPGLDGPALAPALARHTGGNPQFVLETVKALLLAAQAEPAADAASAHATSATSATFATFATFATGHLPLPATVARLIQQRLRQLSPAALKLARLAAVAGSDLSPPLAAQVLGQGMLDLADPWAELEAAGVLRGNAFAHDLVGEGTLETMPQVLAASLHGAVAQWLVQQQGDAARIATHWVAAGRERDAVPWLMQAAAHASARIQLRDAARWCEQAAAICRRTGDAAGELDALEAAVDALFDVELGEHMEQLLQRLLAMPLQGSQRARALRAVAAVRHFKLQDDEALALGRQALALAEAAGQPALDLRIRYGLVQALSNRRELEESEAVIAPVRAWVAEHGDALQRLQLACMEAWVELAAERFESAISAWETVHRLAAEQERAREQAMALNHLQVCWSLMGRFAEGHEAGLRELAIVRRYGLSGTRNIYLDLNLSISAMLLGRYAESIAALARAEKAGVLDQATLHLRRAGLALQLGQQARCMAELQPLFDGRVSVLPSVRFNARLAQLRLLLMQEGDNPERTAAIEAAFADAAALAAGTHRIDHAARLALMRGRIARPEAPQARVAALRETLHLARQHRLHGMQATALAWLAQALAAAGEPAEALSTIEEALALRNQGYVVDQMPGVELDLIAGEVLLPLAPARAAAVVHAALAWLEHTAATEVPEEARHAFLHLHPVHLGLKRLAARLPAQEQEPAEAGDKALAGQSRPA
jgi:DNA-binding SARP family transcriptional activator